MLDSTPRHDPGVWRQQNKAHRTIGHRSKRAVQSQHKGRVNVKSSSKQQKRSLQRTERRNQSKFVRAKKREEVINLKRSAGTALSPPHLTLIIPLHRTVDVSDLSRSISDCITSDGAMVSTAPLTCAGFTANIPRLKHRFQIMQPCSPEYADILNCTLAADTVVFLVACDEFEPVDEQGYHILSSLLAQGVASMVFCTQGIKDLAMKVRNPVKKEIIKKLESYTPGVRFYVADNESDVFNMLRTVAEMKRQKLGIRRQRSYMLVEKQEYVGEDEVGALQVWGHVRGDPLDVNQLIHLVGWGDFQIERIEEVAEHCPWNVRRIKEGEDIREKEVRIGGKSFLPWQATGRLVQCDPKRQPDVTGEAEVDPMEGEQTWPTEEEMKEAEESFEPTTQTMKRVPRGTSEYQAAWILDSDEEPSDGEPSESGDEDVDMELDLDPREEEVSQADECSVIMTSESIMSELPSHPDVVDLPDEVALFREERSHQMFPDEIDTPLHAPARTRFQKYRGLQSFRNSPWDPKENLPMDYAKIFQFQSFNRTRKRIKQSIPDESTTFKAGSYVRIHLKNVPRAYVTSHPAASPLVLFGLLPHEQKMSVLHFAVKKSEAMTIKTKSELLFYVGFRRFRAKPIFSEHTIGSKHKMERFLPSEIVTIATVYAPIMFPPANVLIFREPKDCDVELVATGALYKVDPHRIITKRIVLSGHPFRIHKRGAVIRYMFFNRDDVLWFKPVELRTKCGRRGHIREPVGTHGHMKCVFDDQLTSQDTVLMTLYKRIFPKWSYEAITPLTPAVTSHDEELYNENLFDE